MDAGFIDADLLVEARRRFDVEIIGPVRGDVRWQANAGQGYGLADFVIDWGAKSVVCAHGQRSSVWSEQIGMADFEQYR